MPFGALASAVHGYMTGRKAVLELTLRRLPDSMTRQMFIRRFRAAASDPGVVAIVLTLEAAPGNWAACEDLHGAILAVRKAGKCVYAKVEQPSNALVWIASACDRVFIVPTGELLLVGVGAELTFYGRALENLGVAPDFEAAGAYKSFGEPFTRSFASPANQEAVGALVDDLAAQLVEGIAAGRGVEVDHVLGLVDRAPLSAAEALDNGLVDQLAYADEADDWIEEHHGKGTHFVKFGVWSRRRAILDWIDKWGDDHGVVQVLHLDGPIVMDDNGSGATIRARRVVKILQKLREDKKVKAVVLHVNSPGGHALASDLMWREVDLLQKEKPVVAAFEDVAASGGFYLAAPAAEIIARPTTLTGSIGVFGGKLVMGEGMRKLGVNSQSVLSAPNANLFTPSRPFTDDQRDRFRGSLQRFYDGFVERVAKGRRTAPDLIEPHCRGRVWTGRLAKERGLIDRHGDLYDAVERARELAELKPGRFRRRDGSAQPAKNLLQQVIQRNIRDALPGVRASRAVKAVDNLLARWMTPNLEVVLRYPGEALALLPFDIKVD